MKINLGLKKLQNCFKLEAVAKVHELNINVSRNTNFYRHSQFLYSILKKTETKNDKCYRAGFRNAQEMYHFIK